MNSKLVNEDISCKLVILTCRISKHSSIDPFHHHRYRLKIVVAFFKGTPSTAWSNSKDVAKTNLVVSMITLCFKISEQIRQLSLLGTSA